MYYYSHLIKKEAGSERSDALLKVTQHVLFCNVYVCVCMCALMCMCVCVCALVYVCVCVCAQCVCVHNVYVCTQSCLTLCKPVECPMDPHQGPLSMGFPKQEYCSGLPLPSPFVQQGSPIFFFSHHFPSK